MLASSAYLSLNAGNTFEIQYTHPDDTDKITVVCGPCRCDKSGTDECTGFSLSKHSMSIIAGKRLLLDATDLTTVAQILQKYGVECFDIDYYAIARISTSALIAEHFVGDSEGRPIHHEKLGIGCGRIRARDHFRDSQTQL